MKTTLRVYLDRVGLMAVFAFIFSVLALCWIPARHTPPDTNITLYASWNKSENGYDVEIMPTRQSPRPDVRFRILMIMPDGKGNQILFTGWEKPSSGWIATNQVELPKCLNFVSKQEPRVVQVPSPDQQTLSTRVVSYRFKENLIGGNEELHISSKPISRWSEWFHSSEKKIRHQLNTTCESK